MQKQIPLHYQLSAGAEGAEIVYSLKNNSELSELILDKLEKKGQIKRKSYQRRLPENPNLDYYYILRESNSNEPILIEYGFIDNKKDANKLKNNIEDYAEAVVESITSYLGYPYELNNSIDEYIVKNGDTLYSISRKYSISVDELKRINNLVSNDLKIGQVLLLKKEDNNPIYIVQKGDTLYSIAKNNNISIDDIIDINNLENDDIYIGQELYLPKQNNSQEYDIYIVKKGDSLWSISRQYDLTIPEIVDLNNLDNLELQINQKLLVPKTKKDNIYIVKKGDSLWSISKQFNKSINEIKEKNNLNSNLLVIGQELII